MRGYFLGIKTRNMCSRLIVLTEVSGDWGLLSPRGDIDNVSSPRRLRALPGKAGRKTELEVVVNIKEIVFPATAGELYM